MLSYQHIYHAGNFADCHKHGVLCALLSALQTKDSALTFYDFFAGRGFYSFASHEANKTGEYQQGIAKIWQQADAPPALSPFLQHVKNDNPNGLQHYAGSPVLMQRHLRAQDRLICVDAHPQEHAALEQALGDDPRLTIYQDDAWDGVDALLPAKTPRALLVIDPAYEVKSDYTVLVERCAKALKLMRHAVILIWYPLLSSGHHVAMLEKFQKTIGTKTLNSQLHVQQPQERGMYGSGLLLVNPPWQFDTDMTAIGDWLAPRLAQDQTAHHTLEWLVADP